MAGNIPHSHLKIIRLEYITAIRLQKKKRLPLQEKVVHASPYYTFSHSSALRETNWFGGSLQLK